VSKEDDRKEEENYSQTYFFDDPITWISDDIFASKHLQAESKNEDLFRCKTIIPSRIQTVHLFTYRNNWQNRSPWLFRRR
jgi:hypothetical protein